MGVAEKLLISRDLEGCKQFVSQALSADPNIPGADDLFAAADVLLAARRRRLPSGDPDPYAVLGLDPAVRASRDPEVVHSHYRRLSLLLNRSHPDRPCSLAFADAARLVADAWAFLSDPLWKEKQQHHQPQSPLPPPPQPASPPSAPKQRQAASTTPLSKRGRPARAAKRTATTPPEQQQQQEAEAPQEPAFWTACPSCCHLHKYDRSFEAQTLRCPSCRQPFLATAMVTAPPIVPGTDMYYCSWGFFPLGFPGGPAFTGPVDSPAQQAPASLGFYPMGPYLPLPGQCGVVEGNTAVGAGNAIPVTSTVTAAEPVAAMPEKSSHVKVGAKKRGRPKGSKNKKVVIEIN
ncbi:hypothetical protein PR202_gb02893 [Eleusine coracana subsp. coracana]|uniref:J domain-containing protein n=1 Tax=Eleusine coracana subsp. coracana TaxID=191504 RepID=A0AAV5E0F2_ELECO|nr:hypothetical protein PR202_gb02893 [Eleusine coracana subsp. coracana]